MFVVISRVNLGVGIGFLVAFFLSSLFHPLATEWIAYADFMASSLMALSVLEIFARERSGTGIWRLGDVLPPALYLALAMHFRAPYETLAWALIAVPLTFIILALLLSTFSSKVRRPSFERRELFVPAVALLALIFSIPWRLIAGRWMRPGDYRWSTTPDANWGNRWVPTEIWEARGHQFLIDGHANYGCLADKLKCREIELLESTSEKPYSGEGYFSPTDFRNMLIDSFIDNPLPYLSERLSMFFVGLFSSTGGQVGDFRIAEGFLFLGVFLTALYLGFSGNVLLSQPSKIYALIGLFLFSAVILVFHLETRYVAPIKMLLLVFAAITFAEFFQARRTSSATNVSYNRRFLA